MSSDLHFRDSNGYLRLYFQAIKKSRGLKSLRDAVVYTCTVAYPLLKKEKINVSRIVKAIKQEDRMQKIITDRKMTMFLYGKANITQEVASMLCGDVPIFDILSTIKRRTGDYRKEAPRGSKKQYWDLAIKFDYAYLVTWQKCIQDLKLKGFPPKRFREYTFSELKEILESKMRYSKRELDDFEKRERKFIEAKKKIIEGA